MRRKPDFELSSLEIANRNQESTSCFSMIFVTLIGYFILKAITKVTSGYGSGFDNVLCYGTLAFLVVSPILAGRVKDKEKEKLKETRREWKKSCIFADVSIVDRRHRSGSINDDGYNIHYSKPSWCLHLEPNADQRAVAPNLSVIQVGLYEKLQNRDTVRIYYEPESPLTFLLEEEIIYFVNF